MFGGLPAEAVADYVRRIFRRISERISGRILRRIFARIFLWIFKVLIPDVSGPGKVLEHLPPDFHGLVFGH